ncbi:MAG: 4-alpha-glucanotransferase [Acetanaerobacterium sp.]
MGGLFIRTSGILMHISSLPSPYGIGTFGKAAYHFVDFLAAAGQGYWQILPLGPTGPYDSPYQSFSTFAGNPYFIDLALLEEDGLLRAEDYVPIDWGDDPARVDYDRIFEHRFDVLHIAFSRLSGRDADDAARFARENAAWLDDYALYMALKFHFGGRPWTEWDGEIQRREESALARCTETLRGEINFWRFVQYLFYKQWAQLKQYANDNGVRIIGDVPIYVAHDSADVWANPSLFMLDEQLNPTLVAGCPPDAFSPTGQLWGNPIYRWDDMREDGYAWWMRRMRAAAAMCDMVRIDHFRGFDSYYAIPAGDKTAEYGRWQPGPGYDFFKALHKTLGRQRIIAEDLGLLTDSVHALRRKTGFPGMKVLQFAFDSREESDYLPHNHEKNCVVYTGTHDNDTVCGWFKTAPAADVRFCKRYLGIRKNDDRAMSLIRAAWASVGNTAVAPMQDFLGLGSEARMNTPSTVGGNWQWRALPDSLTPGLARRILALTKLYGRWSDR